MSFPNYLWHPVFVHFSVALLSVATGFFLLARMFGRSALRRQWLTVAEWNLWVGFGFAVFTLLFGWLAFNTVSHDSDAVHELMETHALFALITSSGFGVLTLWSLWHRKTEAYPSWLFVGLISISFGFLAVTGWRGGDLVYRHGLAVSSPAIPVRPSQPSAQNPAVHEDNAGHDHPHHHHHGKPSTD